jgi:hypothetical protein
MNELYIKILNSSKGPYIAACEQLKFTVREDIIEESVVALKTKSLK